MVRQVHVKGISSTHTLTLCLKLVTSVTLFRGVHIDEWLHSYHWKSKDLQQHIWKHGIHWFVYYDHAEMHCRKIFLTRYFGITRIPFLFWLFCPLQMTQLPDISPSSEGMSYKLSIQTIYLSFLRLPQQHTELKTPYGRAHHLNQPRITI